MGHRNITIDDRNTSIIKYTSNTWFLEGSYNASATGESGTLSSTDDPNANLTFVFPQPAVAFYYFAMKRSGGGLYKICIDCDPNDRVYTDVDAYNATDDGHNPPSVLYSQEWDTPTTHEVILQNTEDDRYGNATQITLDRFVLTILDDSVTDPTSSSASSSTSHIWSASSTGATSTSSATAAAAAGKTNNAGVIAGSVVGALAFLVFGSVFLWWWFRGRHRTSAEGSSAVRLTQPEPYMQHPHAPLTYPAPYLASHPTVGIKPFDGRAQPMYYSEKHPPAPLASAPSSRPDNHRSPTHTQGSSSMAYGSSANGQPVATARPPPDPNHSTSPVEDSSSGAPASMRTRHTVPRREIDAGPAEDVFEDVLPPDYNDATRYRQDR